MLTSEIVDELLAFRKQRDWEKFHTPKNLSIAICVESSELLEHFQWVQDSELTERVSQNRQEIENELADIAILLTYLCHDLNVSLREAVRRKLAINQQKYPVEKARGVSTKYDRL